MAEPAAPGRPAARRPRAARGIVDTSVVVDLDRLSVGDLPAELAVSAVTMAELAAGPHATGDAAERARRQDRLQRAEAAFDPLPFDGEAARAYGRIYAAIDRRGTGPRTDDLLVAATACAAGIPLYTRNPAAFRGLEQLVEVIPVQLADELPEAARSPDAPLRRRKARSP